MNLKVYAILGLILIFWTVPAQPEVRSVDKLYTPADAVKLAAADAAKLTPDVARRTRYLMLIGNTAKDRKELWQVLSVHCNALSREPDLVRPVVITSTGKSLDGLLLDDATWGNASLARIILDDYGWPTDVWESLQEDDPYFHIVLNGSAVVGETTVTENWPGGIWKVENGGDGKFYAAGPYTKKVPTTVKTTRALAPWLANNAIEKLELTRLTAATGSQSPVLRADWFYWETGVQADRKVGYYGVLGVKNRADFQRLVGFDQKLSEAFTRELLASVANSGVAQQSRRIARFEKIGGSYWTTFDNKQAVDKANPLRVLNGGFKHDAEEVFSHGSNGLWKVALFAADGTRQDSAPDFVGFDKTTHNNDGRIHVGLSCFRCHQSGKDFDGLQPIKDWSRNLFKPPLALTGPDYETIKKLRQHYLRRLEPFMDGDRKRHAESVREVSGLTAVEWGTALTNRWAAYDSPVDLARAASDLGVSAIEWKQAVDAYMKVSGQTDTVLGMYARPPAEQEPLPLATWHESYTQAHLILKGVRP